MEMQSCTELSKETLEQLSKGAFLTVQAGELVNTMTISWGMIGYIWAKPVFHVLVRESRYTKELLRKTDSFTVSIPSVEKPMKDALAFCGTKSGRDMDKIFESKLTIAKGRKIDTPIIADCKIHYECKIIAKTELKSNLIDEHIQKSSYANNDMHTIYYGEIVDCYITQ